VHNSSGLLLLSTETVQVTKLSAGVIVKVPPLSAVMKGGGPGVAAKVKGAPVDPPTLTLPDVGLTLMEITFPITVAFAVALRA
jgi:hypothetical protein